MSQKKKYVVGLDIGGTKIIAGVIDKNGKIYGTAKNKTLAHEGFDASMTRIIAVIQKAIENAGITLDQIDAIGVGSPGPLDIRQGIVIETPNLGWKNAPLKARIETAFGKPVKVDNDVNTGLLGESVFEAGKGVTDVIGLFVGTGLGGGIIVNGSLLHGFNQNAGELGHVVIKANGARCGCGYKGHLEAYVSKTAIERRIRKAIAKGKPCSLTEKLADHVGPVKSSWLAKAYDAGDPVVQKAIDRSARYLGYGLASFLNIFNPEMVILGGGVVEALQEKYVDHVIRVTQANVFPVAFQNVKIVPAALGDNSGLLGASVLAYQLLEK